MKRLILTLTILLCFASRCPAPDLWMDVDINLSQVPVNIYPLTDSDGTLDTNVVYDDAGISLVWNFTTTGGTFTSTAVTPTTGGAHDWNEHGADKGMYTMEIPAAAGTINNDTEGVGWFSGDCTATLPWRGPTIGFRAAVVNNWLIDVGTISLASVYTDNMTQGNVETYAQTGANAALVALDLDHLLKVSTTVAAAGDLSTYIHDLSVMGHLLSNANVSDYGSDDDSLVVLSNNQATIITDTEMWDTTGEARTMLTGADTPVAKDSTPLTAAEAEAEAVDALESFELDNLLSVSTGVAADEDLEAFVSAGTVMAHLMGIGADVSTFNATEDSQEALGTHADAIDAAAIADAVLDEAVADHQTWGTLGWFINLIRSLR